MKRITFLLFAVFLTIGASAQTMHTLIFVNKCEQGRQVDRTEDFNNMVNFFGNIARTLNYSNDMRTHACGEFTAAQVDREINSLNVNAGDIVVFYYSGHGYNNDDDKWPHLSLNDKNYWQTDILSKLKSRCGNAKLLLCIADCCNKGIEGNNVPGAFNPTDNNYVRQLFTGFQGTKIVIMSASKQGQYSWSNLRTGAYFGICLRKAIDEKTSNNNSSAPTWDDVMEYAKVLTSKYTNNKQEPQYSIQASFNPFDN